MERLRFLLDTNIVIKLEPAGAPLEDETRLATAFVATIAGVHQHLVHPAITHDLARDGDMDRKEALEVLVGKYPILADPPALTGDLLTVVGTAPEGSNDWVDDLLLQAVFSDAVHYLVTEDRGLLRKAGRLRLDDRVLTLRDALEMVQVLAHVTPDPPPWVRQLSAHALDERDPIFDEFRRDYPEFDKWMVATKRLGRQAWVIQTAEDGPYAALCIVKSESEDDEYALGGRVLKLCTFKVADAYAGNRFGELMLKTFFAYANANNFEASWLSVVDEHRDLATYLAKFGFKEHARSRTREDEAILAKRFVTTEADTTKDPLAFHIAYGPPALHPERGSMFVVPVQPEYHAMLFPEQEARWPAQMSVFDLLEPRPFGSALGKAYLCHASTNQVSPGDCLLFYRSGDVRAITTVGVVEDVMRSSDPAHIAAWVGQRTVYSYEEISTMCSSDVLSIRFRQDRVVDPEIGFEDLAASGALRGPPQTIQGVRAEGAEWLRSELVR